MSTSTGHPRIVRIDALAAVDGEGRSVSPASMLLEIRSVPYPDGYHTRLLALGSPDELDQHPAAAASGLQRISRPRAVLIPGLVNAHTHLDLTHLGPRPHDPGAGFVSWVDMIRTGRHADDQAIAGSVAHGIRLSLAAGTVAIGDIAGAPRGRPNLAAWRAMRAAGIRGVSYLEFFGIGKGLERSRAAINETLSAAAAEATTPGTRLGLQPHAPNTVARRLYRDVLSLAASPPWMSVGGAGQGIALPVSTHLAETPEEREFIAHARGPQREMLERLGVWDDSILDDIGRGLHPVQHLAELLGHTPMLVAHVNDADDAAIETLAATRTSVAYCPHASTYFGAARHFGPHRYRDMLAAGVPVALGTDSIVNLPPAAANPPAPNTYLQDASGISILGEMRFLFARDQTAPADLLRMATVNGARALGLTEGAFTFRSAGPLGGLLSIEVPDQVASNPACTPAESALRSPSNPEILFADNYSGLVGTLGRPLI